MTFIKFQDNSLALEWLLYLNEIIYPESNLSDLDEIRIYFVNCFEKFIQLVQETPKRVIANYVFWDFFNQLLKKDLLSPRLQEVKRDFDLEINGSKNTLNYVLSKKCLYRIIDNLSQALSVFYIKKKFDARKREYALNMVEKLSSSFRQILNNVSLSYRAI